MEYESVNFSFFTKCIETCRLTSLSLAVKFLSANSAATRTLRILRADGTELNSLRVNAKIDEWSKLCGLAF